MKVYCPSVFSQFLRKRNRILKKVLAILFAALFVLSFAASAFAIHAEIPSETQAVVSAGTTQITLGGELRIRGWYYDHVSSALLPVKTPSSAWYDERVRLSVAAKVTPNLEGFVQLESSDVTGSHNKDKWIWGNFDAKPSMITILQSWIMYSGSHLLGFPAGIKIGHMPIALGNGIFFDQTKFGDDAIVLFANPSQKTEVDLLTIKLAGEGNPYSDPTFYPLKSVPAGGIPAIGLDNSMFDNTDDLDGYVGIVNYKIDDKNTIGVNYTFLNLSQLDFSQQNFELAGSGNISGVGYKYSADIQFGKASNVLFGGGVGSRDFRGWAAVVAVNYMVSPVKLRASFAYGSGLTDDPGTDNQFETYLDSTQHFTLVYDYNLITAAGRSVAGISNTTYYNFGVDVAPVKDIKTSLDGYILRASEGNANYGGTLHTGLSKDVGWEIDGRITCKIAKNLSYVVDAGYMHAGSFYGDLLAGSEVKNPVVLKHTFTLSF
jgi:hypothetical protein